MMTILQRLAEALKNASSLYEPLKEKSESTISKIERDYLPHGSGFDAGTVVKRDECNDYRIVLHTSFHHMDDNGMYYLWTEHDVVVRRQVDGTVDILIKGKNESGIKDHIGEEIGYVLDLEWKEVRI